MLYVYGGGISLQLLMLMLVLLFILTLAHHESQAVVTLYCPATLFAGSSVFPATLLRNTEYYGLGVRVIRSYA